jgi:alpha-D-ribose 1-methylphosphonate 5-triphosphate diphosphatase PhnM
MSMRDALEQALNIPPGETVHRLQQSGLAIADEDTMAQAIHDVYCGIMADHSHPSEKDHEQARSMIDALQKRAAVTEA